MNGRVFLGTFLILLTVACGERALTETLPLDQTDCVGAGGSVAHIRVSDGILQRQCGCLGAGETQGAIFEGSQSLNCTVNRGTVVYFQYLGTTLSHQILSSTQPHLIVSPLSDPKDGPAMIRIHAVKITEPGTYPFIDAFNPSVGGSLIVL